MLREHILSCRVLRVSSRTFIKQIKRQSPHLKQVNKSQISPEAIKVEIKRVKADGDLTPSEAEIDECWSFLHYILTFGSLTNHSGYYPRNTHKARYPATAEWEHW